MNRAVLQACLPWLVVLLASLLIAWGLARSQRARPCLRRLGRLHGDEVGGVQSLSFVLTLPLFVMVMMFIVQVSQLMIGIMVVHYAAYASARSASVWIPADIPPLERANCISAYHVDPTAPDQVMPVLDPLDEHYGPTGGGMTYMVDPGSWKYQKISMAAVLACMPISPSRDLGYSAAGAPQMAHSVKSAYAALVPSSAANAAVPKRLDNKLAYSLGNTAVEIRFFHKNEEPPLVTYYEPDDLGEFYFNEVGWQDPITVTVRHNLALLPGPGRMLARYVVGPAGQPDQLSPKIQQQGNVYKYPLHASTTIGNEGEKSVFSYGYVVD
jgi:hypothetical protein